MTRLISAALAASMLIAPIAAFAEGNDEAFPSAVTVTVVGGPPAHDVGSQAYQGYENQSPITVAGELEATGGNGHRESANSLPPGFNRGNMFYAPRESVIVARTHNPAALDAIQSAGADTTYASRS